MNDTLEAMELELGEHIRTIDRVWTALGIHDYEQANPFTIWEHVENNRNKVGQLQAELYELERRLTKAEAILFDYGFTRCTIHACNCGGYHRTCPTETATGFKCQKCGWHWDFVSGPNCPKCYPSNDSDTKLL